MDEVLDVNAQIAENGPGLALASHVKTPSCQQKALTLSICAVFGREV